MKQNLHFALHREVMRKRRKPSFMELVSRGFVSSLFLEGSSGTGSTLVFASSFADWGGGSCCQALCMVCIHSPLCLYLPKRYVHLIKPTSQCHNKYIVTVNQAYCRRKVGRSGCFKVRTDNDTAGLRLALMSERPADHRKLSVFSIRVLGAEVIL